MNKILNGTLNQQEATEQIAKQTGISPFNAHTLLEKLIQLGHIEAISQPNLTPEQQTRFSRSTALYSWLGGFGKFDRWAPQEIICSSSICILGAGGIGSSIALQMAASGIGKITLVDFDTVELSNLNRQIAYSEKSIGKLKVKSADVVYEFFRIVGDRLAGIGSGTGLGVVGH
ncbi:HesA/MoeB/ThiF family protein [Corynebacterium striatum]|uniref:HesA/MoeB/ThiF family protein n=1 Tax=Corynebacterium striatum TaxID=43770 RepID=UPI0014192BC4|nr:ThiF family adenylyltransferase [Corynebacterium striatum]